MAANTDGNDDLVRPFEEAPVRPNTSVRPLSPPAPAPAPLAPATAPARPAAASAVAQPSVATADAGVAEEVFEVHTMLLWATRAATSVQSTGGTHPDHSKRSAADPFGLEVTARCVPTAVQGVWRETFAHAVELMLQKTLHGMQHGLLQVAHSVVELIEGTSCGLLAHDGFEKLAEQAERLRVLASAGSLDDLDVAVKYEPLKALTVGGVDIHLELNALIIAWQLNKGPEEVGRALADFLRDFRDESTGTAAFHANGNAAAAAEPPTASPEGDLHETRTPRFWSEVLQKAMLRLGGGHELMSEACLSLATARRYGDALEDAIARMLEKTRQSMRAGIEEVATATINFVNGLEDPCSKADGAVRLRSAAARLRVFASAKTLVDFAKHVEYEPMKVLKVGGIDVHKELNRFLVAWLHQKGAAELAEGLVDFLEDFEEHEVEEAAAAEGAGDDVEGRTGKGEGRAGKGDSPAEVSGSTSSQEVAQEPEVLAVLRDTIAGAHPREEILAEDCVPDAIATTFVEGVERALEHMLQKRKRSMQLGLKELADVTDNVFDQMGQHNAGCTKSRDAEAVWNGAKKLRLLTRKTVVDYGTHIQYEAMKSLVVGSVDIHKELNAFISAWKLRSRREAGVPFGVLMRKLVAIRGHDEL